MKIYVDLDHVDITEYTQIESGEYNTNKINFIFTPEYKDLVKVAIFGCKLDTDEPKFYKIYLSDDSCYLPSEVTTTSDVISIGVYAFNVENGELKLRYSPTPVKTIVYEGSFREEAENSSSPTPTEIEQIMSRIISLEELTSDLNTRVEALENKACDLDSIKEDVDELKNDVQSISGRLDTVESDIDDLEGDIANTYSKTEVDTLLGSKVDTTTFESSQAAQDEKIAKAELILSQLPKVTGEGTNISLSPTIEYDLEVGYKGDTSQNTLNGYNLLDLSQIVSNENHGITATCNNTTGEIILNGTSNGTAVISFIIDLKSGQTVSISNNNPSVEANVATRLLNSTTSNSINAGANCSVVNNYKTGTTLTEDADRFQIRLPAGVTLTNFKLKPILELGSTIHDFEPYCGGIPSPNPNYPQDIQVVTGTQEVLVTGSNLIGLTTQQCPVILKAGDKIVVKNETSETKNLDLFTNLGDSTRNDFCSIQSGGTRVVTVAYDTGAIAWHSDITEGYAWVNKGNTALPYEVYQGSQSYTLHLGDEELCKIGTAQGKIYFDNGKWYKYSAIGKRIFNGSEDGWESTSSVFPFRILQPDKKYSSGWGYNLYSNYFKAQSERYDTAIIEAGTSRLIAFRYTSIANINDFKTWLSTHNTTVYYLLNTPSITEITNSTLLQDLNYIKEHILSFRNTTNISTSGNLPIIITASALKQLS